MTGEHDHGVKYGHAPDTISSRTLWLIGFGAVLFMAATLWIFAALIPDPELPATAVTDETVDSTPLRRQREQLYDGYRRQLTGYEWSDESRQTARIPIQRAMTLLAEKSESQGAPEQPSEPASETPSEEQP